MADVDSASAPPLALAPDGYVPGVCNIGPAEIARRRRAGHAGVVASLVAFGAMVALAMPAPVRLLVALPAAAAASGYLQARLHFCAGFGSTGIFNFSALGQRSTVSDPEALAKDRARSRQISLASLAIGSAVGVVAALLPL